MEEQWWKGPDQKLSGTLKSNSRMDEAEWERGAVGMRPETSQGCTGAWNSVRLYPHGNREPQQGVKQPVSVLSGETHL